MWNVAWAAEVFILSFIVEVICLDTHPALCFFWYAGRDLDLGRRNYENAYYARRVLSSQWKDKWNFQNETTAKLSAEQAEATTSAPHTPSRTCRTRLRTSQLSIHFMRMNEIQQALALFDKVGSSELLTSPVPLFYSRRCTARSLSSWLLLLPSVFLKWKSNKPLMSDWWFWFYLE